MKPAAKANPERSTPNSVKASTRQHTRLTSPAHAPDVLQALLPTRLAAEEEVPSMPEKVQFSQFSAH
ncbi:hypothetical protein ACI394_28525, partial [Klebsiella pneumoniae]|uniref:hypothetical protein n=1 Tax=Klebsiella pneumoniae TaxID=573 RepID=UPI003851838F